MNKQEIIDKLRVEYTRQNYDRVRADVLVCRYLRLSTAYGEALLGYIELLGDKVKADAVREVISSARDAGDKVHSSLDALIGELCQVRDDLDVKLEDFYSLIKKIGINE